ncbi:hypothetical protein F4809DRAFT_629261, partial [Biscogniauxia mediterranea]
MDGFWFGYKLASVAFLSLPPSPLFSPPCLPPFPLHLHMRFSSVQFSSIRFDSYHKTLTYQPTYLHSQHQQITHVYPTPGLIIIIITLPIAIPIPIPNPTNSNNVSFRLPRITNI